MSALKKNSGIILISVLWVVVILALVALSLGRSSGISTSFLMYHVDELKVYAAARAGISKAMHHLQFRPSKRDTFFSCGVEILQNQKPEDLFSDIKVSDQAIAEISFYTNKQKYFGLTDESRRINLNAIDNSNFYILSFLMQGVGVEVKLANDIAASVVDWRDEDKDVFTQDDAQGSEGEYEGKLPSAKNRAFDALQELLLIKGMTKDIYEKIKEDITIYPKTSTKGLQVNINTASDSVMRAILMEANRRQKNINVESLMKSASQMRIGRDGIEFTSDDGQSNESIDLSLSELYSAMSLASINRTEKSEYYRIRSSGFSNNSSVKALIETVVRYDEKLLTWVSEYWHRQ